MDAISTVVRISGGRTLKRKGKTKPVKRVRAFFARDTTASRYALVDRTKNAKPIYITSSDDRRPFRATPSRIYYYVIYTRVHGYTRVFIRIFKSRAVARLILLQRRNVTHRIFVRGRK